MNIIGLDFLEDCSPVNSVSAIASLNDLGSSFESLKIQNAVFDDLLGSNTTDPYGVITLPTAWNNSTVLHAQFNGDLTAGNINYQAKIIDKMRVKRRPVGETKWISLYEKPISKADDFLFVFVDKYAKVGEYEYCIVPVINGTEQNYISKTVMSRFDGIVLCDKNESYKTIADEQISSVTRNRPNNIITTLESKYPYVVYNGSTNYESGSVSGLFVEIDWKSKTMKIDNIPKYSQDVMNFMMNGRPKILKTFDGRIWMADITGSPTASIGGHPNQISISFEFIEIGNTESSSDLYNNAFIDVNVERS